MRKTVVFLVGAAAVLGMAAPAFAHEEINPKQFPTGTPTFFTLSAANEKKLDLTKVSIAAPNGVNFGSTTRSPTGWTVNAGDTQITWTGGAVKPDDFDQWGYEIEGADQPGTLTYKVTLGFSDGSSDDVNVQTTAVAPGTTATTEAKSGGGSAARTRANIALALGAVALVAAVVALVSGRRRTGTPVGEKQDW